MTPQQQKTRKVIAHIVKAVVSAIREQPVSGVIEKRLFNMDEAAIYLGRSRRGMEALVADGKISSVQHDKRRFFDRHDLDLWIDEGRVQ